MENINKNQDKKCNKSAIILCSGGLDSVVTAYYVKKELGYDKIRILFFNYGQKTLKQERKASKKCAYKIGADFKEIKLKWLGEISNSLINKNNNNQIKELIKQDLKDTNEESQKYYVPCRNILFLVYALTLAESEFFKNSEKNDIFVGFKCEGKDSYPDTTKKFVSEINKLSKISCMTNFKIIAPLIEKDKEDIVLLGKRLSVKMEDTYSCYIGSKRLGLIVNNKHCGTCLACKLRQAGFYWANVEDKTNYKQKNDFKK
ncbi:MAG TPA: 7-cyano-7-deazaguanine synthase [Candidatus Paceibacterota bacterium]|nr:7-cyano-7-deazaguanine synthase [Candidatus Paceibacterota bacterium]